MKKTMQKGFAHLGLLLLVIVILAIALIGYKVAKNHSSTVNTGTAVVPQTIPTIKNAADLNNAESTLNSQNVDGDLNPDSLNQDVQSLL